MMKKHTDKITALAVLVVLLLMYTCTVVRDHPLDEQSDSYVVPEIIIDSLLSSIPSEDTIHFDTGSIVFTTGEYVQEFRVRLSEDEPWSDTQWQAGQEFHLTDLEDGAYTLTLQTRYRSGEDITESRYTFYVLTAGYKPAFTDTADSTIRFVPGNSRELPVEFSGLEPLTIQWYHSDSALDDNDTSILTLNDLSTADTGSYYCIASNAFGMAQSRRFILVQAPQYRVVYNSNDADTGEVPVDDSLYLEGDKVVILNNSGNLQREGYTFAGWRTTLDDDAAFYGVDAKITVGDTDLILYVWWTDRMVYSLTYHSNGAGSGTVPVDGNVYLSGTAVTILGNTGNLAKPDTVFTGWSRGSAGTGKLYAADDTVIIGEADLSLYAQWRKITRYHLYYEANDADDGDVPIDTTGYLFNARVGVRGNTGDLTRSGYTFTGWNIASDGSETDFRENDSLSIHGDITLYAQWTDNPTFVVTYSGNGAENGDIPVDSRRYEEGDTVTVATNSGNLSIAGEFFTGWNTAENGDEGTSYTPGATFIMGMENVTLYAQWTANPVYTIIYLGNGNTGGEVPGAVSDEAGVRIAVAARGSMVNKGHRFTGWNSSADGSGTEYAANDTFTIEESDDTLYAQWEINRYTVSYDGNGDNVTGVPQSTIHRYDSEITLDDGVPEWTGHTFFRWNTSENGDGEDYQPGGRYTVGADDITFYARWNVNRYAVSYNGNGNSGGTAPAPDTTGYGDSAVIAGKGNLVRTGCTFTGWNTEPDGSGAGYQPDTTILMGAEDRELFAQWEKNDYTVTFIKNDAAATGNMGRQTIEYDATDPLDDNGFSKTGWSFAGWATSADGPVVYDDGADYTMGAGGDTLYAVWTINSYFVVFMKNSSSVSGNMDPQTIEYDATVALNNNGYTRTGYSFAGWSATSAGSVDYDDGADYTMGVGDDTLYAQWTVIDYSITYHSNGGTNGGNPASFTVESATITLAAASKATYIFGGWYDNASLTGAKIATIPAGSTGDRVFWAKWVVTDVDGNEYTTVLLGGQEWMVENLKTTHYRDGSPIPRVTDDAAWGALTSPGFCWYDNDSATYNEDYGILYNWYAVADTNSHILAPDGWRTATSSDWDALFTFLGGTGVAGGKLKETGLAHWITPNTGATNESGFSGLPGGTRLVNGTFNLIGNDGGWWTENEHDSGNALASGLHYSHEQAVSRYMEPKKLGNNIRCIRGERTHYNVTFNSRGGSVVASQSVRGGDHAAPPAEPTRTDYSFAGWFKEPECSNKWDFGVDVVSGPVVLYAKWYWGNLPGPSAGCGKTFATLESGIHTITSAGIDREYLVAIPENYDPNEPSRVIFCMHWLGGSMNTIETIEYYGLLPLDTSKTTVFIAPAGTPDWSFDDDRDHLFFDDMLHLLKDTLCVDTTRTFACGWSLGAMYTNSLAQTHQDQLRAVACYSTSNQVNYVPQNSGLPIAYMATVGIEDNLTPIDHGRACRDTVLKYNGCTIPGTVPETETGSGTHSIYDYTGCGEYPVKWCTFDGGHMYDPTDNGETTSWIPEETWKFITQF
jgi:uncharacterized protein (TIGR02145 family)/uncharacterized repeat protein (TIGR02543 family)